MSTRRQRRREDVRTRVATRAAAWPRCTVLHCPKPPTGATTSGLNRHYCKAHEDHFERHGSYVKPSYTAAQINPYRRAAFVWLEANSERPAVKAAVAAVRGLYARGGRHEEAFRLRGMSPKERAAAAWARLREAGVDPRLPLAALLAVAMIELDETQPEFRREFRRVQVAKIVHRLASGSHKRWRKELGGGRVGVTEFHKYPAEPGSSASRHRRAVGGHRRADPQPPLGRRSQVHEGTDGQFKGYRAAALTDREDTEAAQRGGRRSWIARTVKASPSRRSP